MARSNGPATAPTGAAIEALGGAFAARRAGLPGDAAGKVDRRRAESLGRLQASGLPTRRQEAWKYTSLSSIADTAFEPVEPGAAPAGLPDGLEAAIPAEGPVVVLVDGFVDPARSRMPDLPGVICRGYGAALAQDPALAERFAAAQADAVTDLNAALVADGVVLEIGEGVVVDEAITIVFLTGSHPRPIASHTRLVVDLAAGARARLVEIHAGPDGGAYLATQAFEVRVADGAHLAHLRRQSEGRQATHLLSGGVTLGRGAVYDGFTLSLGAGLARTETRLVFTGLDGDGRVNGAYIADGTSHVDTTTLVDHAVAECRSREVVSGVLDGRGRGVFQGKIVVRRGAQKTDGHQLSRALLLSRGAEIDTKPELEIYADDVKCSHGATVGEIDREALFYLRARGIDEAAARAMLIEAFLATALDEIADPDLREDFAGHLARRLGERRGDA